jgi:hypothetical protein
MPSPCRIAFVTCVALASLALAGCSPSRAGARASPASPPPILLFAGTGTSPNDVLAFRALLSLNGFLYATADSRELMAMGTPGLRSHRLLIVPGGNFEEIGNGLGSGTSAAVRDAVHAGLNYLGVCAGAFYAGNSPYHGLDLTSGARFGFYALEARGVRKAAVAVTMPGSPPIDHYWEDGPELSGWGDVVATYPDGTPAVVEGGVGAGWVVLAGIHPEAPESWRRGLTFTAPASVANAYAATLVGAALTRTRLSRPGVGP